MSVSTDTGQEKSPGDLQHFLFCTVLFKTTLWPNLCCFCPKDEEDKKLFCNNSKANYVLPTVTPISEITVFSVSSEPWVHLDLTAPYQAPPF